MQENEGVRTAELQHEEAVGFLVRDIAAGLGCALHYTRVTNDAELKRVAIDFIMGVEIYRICDELVEKAKV